MIQFYDVNNDVFDIHNDTLVIKEGMRKIHQAYLPFSVKENISVIILPTTAEEIQSKAFKGFDRLKSVIIPDGVRRIDTKAFEDCVCLESVKIPDSVTNLGKEVFKNCSGLKEVKLPDTLEVLEEGFLSDCCSLKSIKLPNQLKIIKEGAFVNCGLEFIELPDNLEKIYSLAFYGCEHLKAISIPCKIKDIKHGTFQWCKSLEKAEFKGNINSLSELSFMGCVSLKTIDLPSSIRTIGPQVFGNYTKVILHTNEGVSYAIPGYQLWGNKDDKLKQFIANPCFDTFKGMLNSHPFCYFEIALTYGMSKHADKEKFRHALRMGKCNQSALWHIIETQNFTMLDYYLEERLFRKTSVDNCIKKLILSENPSKFEIMPMLLQYKDEIKGYTDDYDRFEL